MQLLDTQRYSLAVPLYEPLSYQLAIQAVLAGVSQGRVYVNDSLNVQMGLVQVGHRLYLSGDSQDKGSYASLAHLLEDEFLNPAAQRGEEGYLLYYHDAGWSEVMPAEVLPQRKLYPGPRHYYEIAPLSLDWQPPFEIVQPEGMHMEYADQALLAQESLSWRDALLEEMVSERSSVEEFLEKSFGLCLVDDEQSIVTWCLSEYNLGARCEIGIATHEAYRRRGLAVQTAAAFLREAARRGYTRVGWHCWAGNSGSVASARRLGMRQVNEHGAFFLPA